MTERLSGMTPSRLPSAEGVSHGPCWDQQPPILKLFRPDQSFTGRATIN